MGRAPVDSGAARPGGSAILTLTRVLQAPAFRGSLVVVARAGYVAKGAVQLLVGALALSAAAGNRGGRITDAPGAVVAMAREPFGRPVLLALGIGLGAYAAVRFAQGLVDPEGRPPGPRTVVLRIGDVISGLAYLLLAYGTILLFLGIGAPVSGDARSRALTGEALALPYGSNLLLVSSLILFILTGWFLARAIIVRDVCTDLAVEELGRRGCRAASLLIRVASLVQTTLFGTMAYLFFRAAQVRNPAAVRGMGGVLRLITAEYGPRALAVLAVGFLAMAGSSFVEARYRRLP
jgi:hypothetical protein